MKLKIKLKRITALFLSVLLILSCFSTLITNAAEFKDEAVGKNATIIELGAIIDEADVSVSNGYYVNGSSAWGARWKNSYSYTNAVTGENETYYSNQALPYHTLNNEIVYCIQPYLCIKNDGNYFSITSADSNKTYWNKLKSKTAIREALAKIMVYSKQKTTGDGAYYHATQLLLWEVIMGIRNPETFTLKSGKKCLHTNVSCSTTAKKTSLTTAYNWIVKKVQTIDNIPEVFFSSTSKAKKAPDEEKIELEQKKKKSENGNLLFKGKKLIPGLSSALNEGCKIKLVSLYEGEEVAPASKWNFNLTTKGNKVIIECEDYNGTLVDKSFFLKITKDIPSQSTDKVYQNKDAYSQTLSGALKYTPADIQGYISLYSEIATGNLRIQKDISNVNGKNYNGKDYKGWNFLVTDKSTKNEYVLSTNKYGLTPKLSTVYDKEIVEGTEFTVEELGYDITEIYYSNLEEANENYYNIVTQGNKVYGMPLDFTSLSKKQTVTIEADTVVTVEWENQYDPQLSLKVRKICEDGAATQGYYFYIYDLNGLTYINKNGKEKAVLPSQIVGPTNEIGEVSIHFGATRASTDTIEICVQELGLLKEGATYKKFGKNFDDYAIPERYDVKVDVEHLEGLKNVVYKKITSEEIDNSYAEVDYENTCSGYVEIRKTDSLTNEVVANAEYGIYTRAQSTDGDANEIFVTDDTLVQKLVTDENGYARSEKLSCGTYYVKELVAPGNYNLDTKLYEAIITPDTNTEENPNLTILELQDKPTQLVFHKLESSNLETNGSYVADAVIQIIDKNGTVVEEFTTTNGPQKFINALIPGETYTIHEKITPAGYATAKDITVTISTDGSVDEVKMIDETTKMEIIKLNDDGSQSVIGAELQLYDSKGNVIDTWVSAAEPHVLEKVLVVGETYTLKELSPPEGYITAEDVVFTVLDTGQTQIVQMYDGYTKVEITKYDITNEKELPGAHLVLKDTEDRIIDEWISTTEPHYIEGKLIVGQTYILTETIAPDGYIVANSIQFTVEDTNIIQKVAMYDAPTRVAVYKYDKTTEKPLSGVDFELTDENGNVVEEWTSTEEAHIISGILVVGKTYYLKEVNVPDGYTAIEKASFVVEDSDKLQVLSLYNDITRVEISKYDITGEKEVEGAELIIYDENKKIVDKWISTDKPHYIEGKLAFGKKYTLHENLAPIGYAYASDVTFTIKNTGEIQKFSMRDDVTKVEIRKIDKSTDKLLPKAKLCIMNSDKEIIAEWITSNKAHVLNGVLEAGKTYILHEIEAPEGYSLAKDIKFTVNKDGKKQVIAMVDYPEKHIALPNTGEGIWYLLGISIFLAGGFAVAYIFFYKKNNKKKAK